MTRPLQPHRYSRIMFRGTIVLLAALTAGIISAPVVQAQTYQVIHRFQGGEGAGPKAGLTIDAAGRLYGTTEAGGAFNFGTVFKLVRSGSG